MRFSEACTSGNAKEIAVGLFDRFGIEVTEQEAERIMKSREFRYRVSFGIWPCDTWASFIRNLVGKFWPQRLDGQCSQEQPDWIMGEFHVFFITIEETQEMLLRLGRKDWMFSADPVRSRLGRTAEFVEPINAVAWRVAPTTRQ